MEDFINKYESKINLSFQSFLSYHMATTPCDRFLKKYVSVIHKIQRNH